MAGADSTYDAIDVARFWSKVDVTRGHGTCWLWRDATRGEYPKVKWQGVTKDAHRIAYEIVHGPIADGLVVRHDCDNPSCCNPLHLRTGTHADNVRDRVIRGRSAKGARNAKTKLTQGQVLDIASKAMPARWYAETYGVSRDNVYAIWERRTWRHLWQPSELP